MNDKEQSAKRAQELRDKLNYYSRRYYVDDLDLKPLPFPQIRLRAPRANTPFSSARRPAAPRKRRRRASARGAGVCLLGAEASSASPSPQNAAGGRPLLVGLPPSTSTTAPLRTKRSAQAPCSWGLGASTQRQRHWQAALPPLLVGLGRVNTEPKALAGGTAAPKVTGRRHCRPEGYWQAALPARRPSM